MNTNESVFRLILLWFIDKLCTPIVYIGLPIIIILCVIFKKNIKAFYQYTLDGFRKKIRSEKAKKIIRIIAGIFASNYFAVFISVICPYFIDCYNSEINDIITIWICGVILNVICNSYTQREKKAQKWFLTTLRKFSKLNNDTSNSVFETRRNMKYIIDSIVENGGVSEQTYEYCFRFETAAQIACEAIYQIVHDVTGYKKHYVTVYKRFQKKENTSCPRKCPKIRNCDKKGVRNEWTQMVACYHEDGNESTSSNQEHCFYYYEDDDTQKQHFYIHFFKENRTGVEIITGEDNIRERFLFHRSTKDREEQIKQYIGIPLYYAEENMDGELEANVNTEERDSQHVTYAVIQIDFRETGILGSTNEAIKEFVDNVFKSIVAYLNTSMQVDNLTRSFLNQIAWVSNVTNNVMYDQLMEAESELDKLWEKNEQLRKKCKEKTKHKR